MTELLPASTDPLSPSRAVGWRGIAVVVFSFVALEIGEFALISVLPHISNQFAHAFTLSVYLVLLAVMLALMFGMLRLRARDIGLVPSKIGGGVLVYLSAWAGLQAVFALSAWIGSGRVALASVWSQPGIFTALVGTLLTYVFGVGLTEEIVFRGFLVPQTWVCLFRTHQPWLRLTVTLLVSQAIFALIHIPSIVTEQGGVVYSMQRLGYLFLFGVLMALVWLQTENLFVAVALHGLVDGLIPLFNAPIISNLGALALAAPLVTLLLWPVITRRSGLRAVLLRKNAAAMPVR